MLDVDEPPAAGAPPGLTLSMDSAEIKAPSLCACFLFASHWARVEKPSCSPPLALDGLSRPDVGGGDVRGAPSEMIGECWVQP